ncbi:hypothetical protein HDU85_001166 [Gaertneriomyces sp. JEL0708]|nr:hypothetical protein HDU85_001166 [Gaertneriomyces sp. JEL0708]
MANAPSWWKPTAQTPISWHWHLKNAIPPSLYDAPIQMIDLDLFDTPASTISQFRSKNIKVICYFSAGSFENWRPDQSDFKSDMYGKAMEGWDGEWWLDIRKQSVKDVMTKRLDMAKQKGCDGVEPDNVDGYINDTGLPLTATEQLAYNRFLAQEAHSRSLSIGLKNDLDQLTELVGDFDWLLNEECVEFNECQKLTTFINANKAVFGVSYVDESKSNALTEKKSEVTSMCNGPKTIGANYLVANRDLDREVYNCVTGTVVGEQSGSSGARRPDVFGSVWMKGLMVVWTVAFGVVWASGV